MIKEALPIIDQNWKQEMSSRGKMVIEMYCGTSIPWNTTQQENEKMTYTIVWTDY
jgi:hypothetical protein